MGELSYAERRRLIYSSEKLEGCILCGGVVSPLIIGRENGRTKDCFFTMSGAQEFYSGPLYIVKCEADRKETETAIKDVSALACRWRKESNSGSIQNKKEYETLYPKVRSFAFSETLSVEEQKILKDFCIAMKVYFGRNIVGITERFFPEFSNWTDTYSVS
ncbi:MAG TPA: hypothetical protein PLN48_18150 [Lachnospiraceae bacterium]|nr:hypothetical protein [Lachnospiraceae bacterium]